MDKLRLEAFPKLSPQLAEELLAGNSRARPGHNQVRPRHARACSSQSSEPALACDCRAFYAKLGR